MKSPTKSWAGGASEPAAPGSPNTGASGSALVRASAVLRRRARFRTLVVGWSVWVLSTFLSLPAFAQQATLKVTDIALSAPKVGAARIVIKTSGTSTYTARVAEGGKRIILDLPESVVSGAPSAIVEGNAVVSGVMTQSFADPAVTRVLIQLAHNASYSIRRDDDGLVVELVTADKTGPLANEVKAPAEVAKEESKGAASIRDVRYSFASDRDRVVIEIDKDAKFSESSTKGKLRIQLDP